MRIIVTLFIFFTFLISAPFMASAEEKDCSCPRVTCGPCQKKVTVGKIVKFCDWGDINVCRKTICENVNFYFGCLSALKNKGKKKSDDAKGDVELAYEKDEEESRTSNRRPASRMIRGKRPEKVKLETDGRIQAENDSRVIPGEEYSDLVAGEIIQAHKNLKIFHRGQITQLKKGTQAFVGDEIVNDSKKATPLKIRYKQGVVSLKLYPKSKLLVEDPHSIVGRFQPFLYLVHGGCDFKVDFKEGSFDLLAGQILTRTKSGHQKVIYEMDQEGLKVKVESLADSVQVLKAQNLSGKAIQVAAGNFVSWVSETSRHLFSLDEKNALAGEGFITPIFQMPESRRKSLGLIKEEAPPMFTSIDPKPLGETLRAPASVGSIDTSLCQTPAGQFQQCAWSCEGNPKGAKSCQSKKDNVHCVRRVCNAAGQWGAPTAFASSYGDLCPSSGIRVGDCSP